MFDVGRSMFDVQSVLCSAFDFLRNTVRMGSDPWREVMMKNLVFGLVLVTAAWGLAIPGLAQDTGRGTVSGVIRVEKARVKTSGAKSFKDVIVYLKPLVPGMYPPPAAHAVMDQKGLVFIPHVMAVQRGTTVDFLNSDHDRHNVYFLYDDTGETLDIGTWGPGQTVSHTFEKAGLVITLCQLHLEMAAYILVLEYPFFTVSGVDAETRSAGYEIRGVPAGKYELGAWHKKLKMKGGAVEVAVAAGETTAMDITITRAKYAK
jgi:plastocyanin